MHRAARPPPTSVTTTYEFGPFRLDPRAGVLTRLGVPEPLGPRAVAVLAVLVGNAPSPVRKDAILEAAWPGLVVEEANLTVQISSIRRVLAQAPGGERWVQTLARRGYRFVGPVTALHDGRPHDISRHARSNLPEPLTSFVGRERELVELKRLLAKRRLLTLIGAGGIGKTRLALQLAAEVKDAYRDGAWLIDLAPLAGAQWVASGAAQVLGVAQAAGKPLIDALCAHVRTRRLLLVFDNCEHVLDASARLIEAMLHATPEITIVATSREPLRIGGEQIYRLPTLSLAEPAATCESIARSEAVQLFVDRAQHQQADFSLTPQVAEAVADLCLRLDGIPLALELAAAQLHVFSVDQMRARLHDRFDLLTSGYRTALPRQQTLRATLDWSHDLLAEDERRVLRRVSLFLGGFTLEASAEVDASEGGGSPIAEVLSRLAARSLVAAEVDGDRTRYRLLETTRAYALEKLSGAGEAAAVQRRHAVHFRDLCIRAAADWVRLPDLRWRALYLPEIDNVRAALEWSISPAGDPVVAVALAGGSGPLWSTLSLFVEGISHLGTAASRIEADAPPDDAARLWMWLGLLLEEGTPADALSCHERALGLYRAIDDRPAAAHVLVRLARLYATAGRFEQARAALAEARPLLKHAGLPKLLGFHHANAGYLCLLTGDLAGARNHLEKGLPLFREAGYEFGIVTVPGSLAEISWTLGDLPAAAASYREAVSAMRAWPRHRKDSLGFALANLAGVLTESGAIDEALAAAREGIPLLMDRGRAWIFMDHLALLVAQAGSLAIAARIAGHADAAFAAKGSIRQPNEARAHARLHALLRDGLDPADRERLLAEGARMSESEACRAALVD